MEGEAKQCKDSRSRALILTDDYFSLLLKTEICVQNKGPQVCWADEKFRSLTHRQPQLFFVLTLIFQEPPSGSSELQTHKLFSCSLASWNVKLKPSIAGGWAGPQRCKPWASCGSHSESRQPCSLYGTEHYKQTKGKQTQRAREAYPRSVQLGI